MAEKNKVECVVKFKPIRKDNSVLPPETLKDLMFYRDELFNLRLIGSYYDVTEDKYIGYGNISKKIDLKLERGIFAITGTQTGHLPRLSIENYVSILSCDIENNSVEFDGEEPNEPSSEAMTHYAIYISNPKNKAVIHVHSKRLWGARNKLKIPTTKAGVEYGTPEMARELTRLCKISPIEIIAMESHEEGIIAWGDNFKKPFDLILQYLELAK